MSQLKPHQKDLVKNFRQFTNCRVETAEKFLSQNKWDFNTAINSFFERGYVQPVNNAAQLFSKYKTYSQESDRQIMNSEGLVQFLSDINVSLEDPFCGYLLYLMHTQDPNEITLNQFSKLINYLNCNNIQSIKKQIPKLKGEFQNPEIFKQVYYNLFELYKQNPKFIKFQNAISLWTLYLKGRFVFYNQFFQFIQSYNKNISKDLWRMVYDFQLAIKGNLDNYKETDGWPVLIDNFVQHLKNK